MIKSKIYYSLLLMSILLLTGCSTNSSDIKAVKKTIPLGSGLIGGGISIEESVNQIAGVTGKVKWFAFKPTKKTNLNVVFVEARIEKMTVDGSSKTARLQYLFNRDTKQVELVALSIGGEKMPLPLWVSLPKLLAFQFGIEMPANGQIKSDGEVKDGKPNGKVISRYENGQIKSEIEYKDGKQNGKAITWYANGQIKSEAEYKDGKQNGKCIIWYENGQKELEDEYKDGKPNGKTVWWYDNGQKESEGEYKDGKQNGKAISWYDNGQKEKEAEWKDGKLIRQIYP